MNKTILFNDVKVSKKEFYDTKKAIPFKNNETSKYFIGYLDDGSTVCYFATNEWLYQIF